MHKIVLYTNQAGITKQKTKKEDIIHKIQKIQQC